MFVFILPARASFSQDTYPIVEISGYKKYEYLNTRVSPTNNTFLGLQHLGVGYGFTSGPWQERLELRVLGRLSEHLSVTYDLAQQPDIPERYHVKVNYDNTELTFGDFTAGFGGNEFASTTKTLNGVLLTSYDNWYDLTFVPSAKIQSYSLPLTTQAGNNTAGPYNLGHTSIVEGSEYIELNSARLSRDVDYTIDYFEGMITFKRILSTADVFKYSYEFTNMIDVFFPSISKRDFFGFRGSIDPFIFGKSTPKEEPVIIKESDEFPSYSLGPKQITREVSVSAEVIAAATIESGIPAGEVIVNDVRVMTMHDIGKQSPGFERAQIIAERLARYIQGTASPEMSLSLGSIEGDWVGYGASKVLFTVDRREAAIVGVSPEVLAANWVDNLKISLAPRITTEVVEVSLEANEIPAEAAEEEIGTYQLQSHPIVMYSEIIEFEGARLKKDSDYTINYETGTIQMLIPTMPSKQNRLRVAYEYYKIEEESEVLPGTGARGPYDLTSGDIIPGSEKVVISQIPNVRDLDYTIDYKEGRLMFYNKILATQNISVKYRRVAKSVPPVIAPEGPEQAGRVGVTYLLESAKKGPGLPTESGYERFTLDNKGLPLPDNTIYLKGFPLDMSSLPTVTMNGVILNYGTDYVIPSTELKGVAQTIPPGITIGFRVPPTYQIRYLNDPTDLSDGAATGTIKILATIESTSEVTVSYSSYKKVYNTLRFEGAEWSRGPIYLEGTRGMAPGSEQILMWDEAIGNYVTYYPNPSTTEVISNGYSINYAAQPWPSITFNDQLTPTRKKFIVNFWYVPVSNPTGKTISQSILGFDGTYKIGDFNIEGAIAKSETDKVYGTLTSSESFSGNGGRLYTLGSPADIVEDSEKVFMNEHLLNKDRDYSIDYFNGGQLSFFTDIATLEEIRVVYDYLDAGVGDTKKKEGWSYKLGGGGKLGDAFDFRGSYKEVGYDFTPMGGLPIGIGSNMRDFGFGYKPYSFFSIGGYYKLLNDLANQKYKDKFVHNQEWSLNSASNVYDMMTIDLGYRQATSFDDLLTSTQQLHNGDNRSDFYSTSITPKQLRYEDITYSQKYDYTKTLQFTDTLDRALPVDSTIDYFRTAQGLKYQSWADLSVDYQQNEPITRVSTKEGGSELERETAHTKSKDITYTTNLDLTNFSYWKINKLSTMARLDIYDNADYIAHTMTLVRNQTYHVDFNPVNEITTSYHNDRQETPSTFIENLGNPRYERTYGNVRYTPISYASLYWSGAWDDTIQDNGAQTANVTNSYSLDFSPPLARAIFDIPLPTESMTLTNRLSTTSRKSLSTPYKEATTTTIGESDTFDTNLTYYPHPLVTLVAGMNLERYINDIEPGVNTDTLNMTYTAGTTYRPDPKLTLSANYNHKETRNNKTGDSLPKEVYDAHASYNVFTYGTLTYDWIYETNRGEVLAGSISVMDIRKLTNGITLTITIPQNNFILNNIVFNGKWRQIGYEDRLAPSNDFTANQLSFDGTLNF